ncbi:MAG: ABC transporter substrate-binding protein [Thermoanaerobaculia bacterium]|nr:ABC transporter substrate-binding protein [Thermoanaerobaculia bacterium]
MRGLGDSPWKATLAGVLLAAALLAAPTRGQESPGDGACDGIRPVDLRSICERGELRVARYRGQRPPFFFERDGRWVGFDVDLGRDIATRLGVEYREIPTAPSFDAVVDRVAEGSADLGLSKLSATLARATRVRFSRPYLTVYQALLVNRLSAPAGADPFRALDAAGTGIGALDGSAYVGYARASFRAAEVRPYSDFSAMMDDVVAGRLDAALMDSARANTWRRRNREKLVQVRSRVDKSRRDPLAIAVSWDKTHLLAWIDLYLDGIEADGTAERLYRKWFVDDPGVGSEGESR